MRIGAYLAAAMMLGVAACSTNTTYQGPDEVMDLAPSVAGQPADPAGAQTLADILSTIVGDRIYFALDRHDLSAEAQDVLTRQAGFLRQYPDVTVTIEGHCDERGTREYNLGLGERRAAAARSFLVALGIGPARIATVSSGKERPAVLGSDEVAWSQNRRSVTVLD